MRLPSITARRILGVLILAMATGQALDLGGFVDIIETYELGPTPVSSLVAAALFVGELLAAHGLLAGRRTGPAAGLAVAVAWSIVGAQAFLRGLDVPNCGCFGVHLGQPLRWWVLVQDVEFMLLAGWVVRQSRHRSADEELRPLEPAPI